MLHVNDLTQNGMPTAPLSSVQFTNTIEHSMLLSIKHKLKKKLFHEPILPSEHFKIKIDNINYIVLQLKEPARRHCTVQKL